MGERRARLRPGRAPPWRALDSDEQVSNIETMMQWRHKQTLALSVEGWTFSSFILLRLKIPVYELRFERFN